MDKKEELLIKEEPIIEENAVAQDVQPFAVKENVEELQKVSRVEGSKEAIDESDKKQEELANAQKQKFDEYEQTVSKQSSKKSKIINIIFFVVNIAVVAGILAYQISKNL